MLSTAESSRRGDLGLGKNGGRRRRRSAGGDFSLGRKQAGQKGRRRRRGGFREGFGRRKEPGRLSQYPARCHRGSTAQSTSIQNLTRFKGLLTVPEKCGFV